MAISRSQLFIRLSIGSLIGSFTASCIWLFAIIQEGTPIGSANLARRQQTAQTVINAEVEHHKLRVQEAAINLKQRELDAAEDQRNERKSQ